MEHEELIAEELARERIADALKNDSRALNLSPAPISLGNEDFPGDERFRHLVRLPPEVAELTSLRSLGLRETKVSELSRISELTELQRLYLSSTPISDISVVAKLNKLEALYLRNCAELNNLSPLSGLRALKELDLERVPGVSNLSIFIKSISLEKLWISGTNVSDISIITSFPELTDLDISDTVIADLCPLARLRYLRKLQFSGTPACGPDVDDERANDLARLSRLDDHGERTRQTLEHLRSNCPPEETEFDQERNDEKLKQEHDGSANRTRDPQTSSPEFDSAERLKAAKAIAGRSIAIALVASDLHDRVETEIARQKGARLNSPEAAKNVEFLEGLLSSLSKLSDTAARLSTEPTEAEVDQAVDESLNLREQLAKYTAWVMGEKHAKEIADFVLIAGAASLVIQLGLAPIPVTLAAVGKLQDGKLARRVIDLAKQLFGK